MRLQRMKDMLEYMMGDGWRKVPPMVAVDALNGAVNDIMAKIQKVDHRHGVMWEDITPASEDPTILPERVGAIFDLRPKENSLGLPLEVDDPRYRQSVENRAYLVSKFLEFGSPPETVHRLYYHGAPWPMFLAKISSASDESTFVLESAATIGEVYAEDNYYLNAVIRVTDISEETHERTRVTGFTAKTRTMTVSPALSATPATGDTVEIECAVPAHLHTRVVDMAFARLTRQYDLVERILKDVGDYGVMVVQRPPKIEEEGF